ncbi:sensor histidine kinase [Nocardia sp. NPDC003693]
MRDSVATRRRVGLIFAAVWAVYLVDPLRRAWSLDNPLERAYSLGVVVAFGVCFVGAYWYLLRGSGGRDVWIDPHPRTVILPLALLCGLLAAAALTLRSEALGLAIFVGTFIAFALPVSRALVALAVLIAGTTVTPQLLAGEPPAWATMSSIAMSAFAVGGIREVIRRNQQLSLARKQLTELAIAEERLRVGRDVHDILGHSLTVITVKTELAQRLLDVDPERARAELADVERLAREALSGVRSTVGGLREVSLAGELANARTALSAAEIEATLPDSDELPLRHSVVFGWVLREAVTNVVRHSGARHCVVSVTATSIEITDDGVGSGADPHFGSGLSGLRERVRATGGTLTVTNRPEGGLRVLATFPARPMKELE